jgi:hypothetical protein
MTSICTIGERVVLRDVGPLGLLHWDFAPDGEEALAAFVRTLLPAGWTEILAMAFDFGSQFGLDVGNSRRHFAVRGALPTEPGRHDIAELVTRMCENLNGRIALYGQDVAA